jgi:hypothetical protein
VSVDILRMLRQHFTTEQAEDILNAVERQGVTRDYLKSELEALEKRLTLWGIGLAGTIVALSTILQKLIP